MKVSIDSSSGVYVKFTMETEKSRSGKYLKCVDFLNVVNNAEDMKSFNENERPAYVYINEDIENYKYGQIYKYSSEQGEFVLADIADGDRFIVVGKINKLAVISRDIEFGSGVGENSIIEFWQSKNRSYGKRDQWVVTLPVDQVVRFTSNDEVYRYEGGNWGNFSATRNGVCVYVPLCQFSVIQDPDKANLIYISKGSYLSFRSDYILSFYAEEFDGFVDSYKRDVADMLDAIAAQLNGVKSTKIEESEKEREEREKREKEGND